MALGISCPMQWVRKLWAAWGHLNNAVALWAILAGALTFLGTFFGSAAENLSVTAVWVYSLAAALLVLLLVFVAAAFLRWIYERPAVSAREKAQKPFGPDWTLRELFLHIEPDVLDTDNGWERIGRDILDKLSTGQLSAWGRARRQARETNLAPIPTAFWANATFTYFFFAEDATDQDHAIEGIGVFQSSYSDIRVNRAQALSFWPEKSTTPTSDVVSRAKAVVNIASGRLRYVERVLAENNEADLRKWLRKIDHQRVDLEHAMPDSTTGLTSRQATALIEARLKNVELNRCIDNIIAERNYTSVAHAAGLYAHRVRELLNVLKILTGNDKG
jgi:hypothetical protein